jgi:SAM-dependent methyltransferase
VAPSPFTSAQVDQIYSGVKKKYAGVAAGAAGFFRYTVGKEGARALGYDAAFLDKVSDELMSSFCGVGNPFTLAPIAEGNCVLDIGCGAGYDVFIASRLVGPEGKVFGVDLTAEMVDRARDNLNALQVKNVEILQVKGEQLPFDKNYFDAVISNGVINLSPSKSRLFAEIFRVLKPGGRLQFADIVLEKEMPPHLLSSVESWSQ